MNHGYETADGTHVLFDSDGNRVRTSPFPEAWGQPPELRTRAGWIREHILADVERVNRGEKVEGQRVKNGRQALAALTRMRTSPAFANQIRLRLLELRARLWR